MQKLELQDFLNYRYASELAFAPDGAHAAYVVTRACEQDNGYDRYGLFYDPDPSRVYYRLDEENPTQTTDEVCVPAAPKLTAYAFQTAAGGSGSLTLLSEQQ